LFVSLFEHYTLPVSKRRDPPKVSSPETKKLHKNKKEELSDPPYVPPVEEHKTRSKNESNLQKTTEEMGLEDGVVGQVNVAEEEHVVVVSCTLTSDNLYEFLHCLKSFII
jgi:hypothetical protein